MFTKITPEAGTPAPAGAALFSYTNSDGILISQAGVEAAKPISSGRVFVDEVGTKTGLAMVIEGSFQNVEHRFPVRTGTLYDGFGTSCLAGLKAPIGGFVSLGQTALLTGLRHHFLNGHLSSRIRLSEIPPVKCQPFHRRSGAGPIRRAEVKDQVRTS